MKRFQSLDLLRGLIMVLMAIDHVRCLRRGPAGGPTCSILHAMDHSLLCAGFLFFAGTAAFLYGISWEVHKH